MSINAYARIQRNVEAPRATEYRLFAQVTAALDDARARALKGSALMDALDWNRRMWLTLAHDCAQEGNQLAPALRGQLVSLALFVNRQSSAIMRGQADITDLIDINRTVMEGLADAPPRPVVRDAETRLA